MTDRSAVVTDRSAVEAAIIEAHRREWAFVVAATVRVACDLDLAEECVQEAYAAALQSWPRDGVPTNPAAWLTTTAKRRAVDAIRRDQVFRSKLPLLIEPEELVEDTIERQPAAGSELDEVVRDERLRLIFLCCHPALARDGQVALTLRLVCGLSTSDIARAFLVSEATMAARITRAKRKIAGSRIPYRLPPSTDTLVARRASMTSNKAVRPATSGSSGISPCRIRASSSDCWISSVCTSTGPDGAA